MKHDSNILTPKEVAVLFHVDPKTVSRWTSAKKIRAFKTPGGHYRYHREDVEQLLKSSHESI